MEFRQLGKSGLKVPVLSFGTATFGGSGDFFKAWGSTDVSEAKRMIDLCLDSGLNFFDTANGYSGGAAEEILGQAVKGKRQDLLLSTKATFPMGPGPNQVGSSRKHLIEACDASLTRLKTDYIDLYHMHGMDAHTPLDETLETLTTLMRSGKIRYIACSNYSAWHLMKAMSISERRNYSRFIAHQVYYSLVGRDVEWELIPLGLDQGIGTIVWSPLAGGALAGKISRTQPPPKESRLGQISFVQYENEVLYNVVDVLKAISNEIGRSIAQVALNWLLQKPSVCNIIVGARNEEQLKQNLGAVGWNLSSEHMAMLDKASQPSIPYPYWHQKGFPQLVPDLPPVRRLE